MKEKVIVVVGPTASGKSALAVRLAHVVGGEVVSSDSRQVYRGLDLGTGKITREEMEGIPHHLLDVAHPVDTYTVADFVRDGAIAIEGIRARERVPIVVGGTFLYVDALLGHISTPPVAPNPALRKTLEEKDTGELASLLKDRDPKRAHSIDLHNRRRLIRALEIVDALGSVPPLHTHERYHALKIGINIPRDVLKERIRARLHKRFDEGMLEEARKLTSSGITYERMHDLGLEYREMAQHLVGECSYEEMVKTLETKIYQFAKRQMTWLKRDLGIHWIDFDKTESAEVLAKNFLRS